MVGGEWNGELQPQNASHLYGLGLRVPRPLSCIYFVVLSVRPNATLLEGTISETAWASGDTDL